MKKAKLIDAYVPWICQELTDLTTRTGNYKTLDSHGTFEWPLSKTDIYPEDIRVVGVGLSKGYETRTSQCAIVHIETKIEKNKNTIDEFFLKMHCLGHMIINDLRPELDAEDLHDITLIETTALLFSIVLCRHYFNLDHLTPEMAKELAWTFYDQSKVELLKGTKHTHTERVQLCSDMLDVIQEKTVMFQH